MTLNGLLLKKKEAKLVSVSLPKLTYIDVSLLSTKFNDYISLTLNINIYIYTFMV